LLHLRYTGDAAAGAAAAGGGAALSSIESDAPGASMSAALHEVVHEVLGDGLTLAEAQQMLNEVDDTQQGKISLAEVSEEDIALEGGGGGSSSSRWGGTRRCLADLTAECPCVCAAVSPTPSSLHQFTELVMGHQQTRGDEQPSPSDAAADVKAATASAQPNHKDDTALVK
jgi:hypothetical protein